MGRAAEIACLAALGLAAASGTGESAEGMDKQRVVNTLRQIQPALTRCWRPPRHALGMSVTVRFSLTRKGNGFGKPAITHASLNGPVDLQSAFLASVLKALANCTPVKLSERMGAAVAGRPLSIRFARAGLRAWANDALSGHLVAIGAQALLASANPRERFG
jgi:hypothetical protein